MILVPLVGLKASIMFVLAARFTMRSVTLNSWQMLLWQYSIIIKYRVVVNLRDTWMCIEN